MSPEEQLEREQIAQVLDILLCITRLPPLEHVECVGRASNNQFTGGQPLLPHPDWKRRAQRERARARAGQAA